VRLEEADSGRSWEEHVNTATTVHELQKELEQRLLAEELVARCPMVFCLLAAQGEAWRADSAVFSADVRRDGRKAGPPAAGCTGRDAQG
jgi:hypothetical protein